MPGAIDKALSGNTLALAGAGRDQGGIAAPDASLAGGGGGGMGDVLQALMSGQVGAEQLLQLLIMLSQAGAGGGGLGGPDQQALPMGPPQAQGMGAGPIEQALVA